MQRSGLRFRFFHVGRFVRGFWVLLAHSRWSAAPLIFGIKRNPALVASFRLTDSDKMEGLWAICVGVKRPDLIHESWGCAGPCRSVPSVTPLLNLCFHFSICGCHIRPPNT